MKKSVFVRIAAAVMAIVLCLCSMGALAGCTKTRSINVLVYGQYIDLDVISNFKKENGIKVNVDECDTPEELYNKAVNGDQSYDLICTSDYIIERFIKENRLSELNFDNIPNIKNIGEVYLEKSKSFDPENKYSVPHFWGTVGVIYNTKMVSEEDAKSWKMFFNEKYSGKIIMSNSIRDSFLVALEALGYSLNTTDKAQIDEAKQLLIKQKPMLKAYLVETEARDAMISGEAAMALVYNGEAYLAIEGDEEQNISGNPDLKFTIPEEARTSGSIRGSSRLTARTRLTPRRSSTTSAELKRRRRTSSISIIRLRTRLSTMSLIPRFSRMRISSRPARLSTKARFITTSEPISTLITAPHGKK